MQNTSHTGNSPQWALLAAAVAVACVTMVAVGITYPEPDLRERAISLLAEQSDEVRINHSEGVVELAPRSVSNLSQHFQLLGYEWQTEARVPRVELLSFPHDIKGMPDASARKRIFFQAMTPLILMENERIRADRERLLAIYEDVDMGDQPTDADGMWLVEMAARYGVNDDPATDAGRRQLLTRVNTVPVSLALAMAAHESAWGTSRFCAQGNNLFGEWTYERGTGIVPQRREAGRYHEVAVFPDLASSVRSYIGNLNSNRAYAEFRRVRATLADPDSAEASVVLASTLTRYSERGTAYTQDIAHMIRHNRLTRFDGVRLDGPIVS